MAEEVSIAGRVIGAGQRPYIIAEMSGNHNGDINRAFRLMEAAKQAGADALKLQTYRADTITIDHDSPDFIIEGGTWDGRGLYELYDEAHTPWEWHADLMAKGRELGLTVFSTPFDHSAVDFLEDLNVPAYKIASFEMMDFDLLQKVASTKKPLIMSTGMANLAEIAQAVDVVQQAGASELVLLHCVSGYPAPPQDAHLHTIPHMRDAFNLPVGLSDHSHGIAVSVAAVALGASVIEKHFTLARSDGGPDSSFSLEPDELRSLVEGCAQAHDALGQVNYHKKESEAGNLQFRRSIYIVKDIKAGEKFTRDNIRSIRPGHGLPPKYLKTALSCKANKDLKRGMALSWADLLYGDG